MAIAEGSSIPADVSGRVLEDGKPTPKTLGEIIGNKKTILFGLPGAFTPPCTKEHLPSFATNTAALQSKGIEQVICTAVNDIWVMEAWNQAHGGPSVTMLADGNAEIARALGMDVDLSAGGMGTRSTRYAMYIDNGVIKAINQEEKPGTCTISSAQGILERI